MNTDYRDNPFAAFGSTGKAGVDLAQLFVTPSLAYKPVPDHAFGAAVTFAYQQFEAKGLSAFDNPFFTSDPGSVTNNGKESGSGWGLKLGWLGKLGADLSLGVSWSSRIDTDTFDKYSGLFAEQGGFDIPENYAAGLAWQVSQALTLATDWQHIRYSEIKSVGNPLQNLLQGNRLGTDDGGGFGWDDVDVAKLGLVYAVSPELTLRAGYSHASQAVPDDQTLFNILAPGVIRDHVSLGASRKVGSAGELTVAYTHGIEETVSGNNSIPLAFGGGEADIHLAEDIVGVAWQGSF